MMLEQRYLLGRTSSMSSAFFCIDRSLFVWSVIRSSFEGFVSVFVYFPSLSCLVCLQDFDLSSAMTEDSRAFTVILQSKWLIVSLHLFVLDDGCLQLRFFASLCHRRSFISVSWQGVTRGGSKVLNVTGRSFLDSTNKADYNSRYNREYVPPKPQRLYG